MMCYRNQKTSPSDIEMVYIYAVTVKGYPVSDEIMFRSVIIHVYFPDHHVRFIAVNDGSDSEVGESKIAPRVIK